MRPGSYKILVIEECKETNFYIRTFLKEAGYNFTVIEQAKLALKYLEKYTPDLIIADIAMYFQIKKGLSTNMNLKATQYILMTTKKQLEASNLTVSDYIIKPFSTQPEFMARVQAALVRYTKYQQLQNHDELTSLINKKELTEILTDEISRAKRYVTKLSIFMFDIDYFKDLNDAYGMEAGDSALLGIAEYLKCRTRETDFAGRLGGDEFIIIMPETPKEGCIIGAERIRQDISYLDCGPDNIRVTISGGTATSIEDGEDIETLLANATQALNEAKLNGGNKILPYAI